MEFKIETIFDANVLFEINVAVGEYTYLVIYGEHINGNFCCIPNWKLGCEMSFPNEVVYNQHKLIDCGVEKGIAKELAKAIQTYSSHC